MAKNACWVRKVYWRRGRAHDKTRVSVMFVVCTAGAFIGCVAKVKSEKITRLGKGQKFDKTTKNDKVIKGE